VNEEVSRVLFKSLEYIVILSIIVVVSADVENTRVSCPHYVKLRFSRKQVFWTVDIARQPSMCTSIIGLCDLPHMFKISRSSSGFSCMGGFRVSSLGRLTPLPYPFLLPLPPVTLPYSPLLFPSLHFSFPL